MTAIAAFRVQGVPALLGDLTVTRPGQLPGSTRKLRRLTDDVVLGWTGSLLEADALVSVLEDALSGRTPARSEFESFLASAQTAPRAPISLVGWIRDQAFKWDSGFPHHVTWSHRGGFFVGSGGMYVENVVTNALAAGSLDPAHALTGVVAALLADETGRQVQGKHPFNLGKGRRSWCGPRISSPTVDNVTVIPISITGPAQLTYRCDSSAYIYKLLVDDEIVIVLQ